MHNRDLNPGPLAFRASALPTELLRPNILTDSHTPGYPVTMKHIFSFSVAEIDTLKRMRTQFIGPKLTC